MSFRFLNAQLSALSLLGVAAALLLSGCATSRNYRLPPISADEVTVEHRDWFGGITARATDIKVTEKYITAATAEWEVTYGGWHDKVVAKGYRQRRAEPEIEPAPAVPPLLAKP